ncbi:uncharacterized protein BO72DRAFT_453299 [Aspergillus fijiensis CBS 313.89]|uniref:Uncharacterized protein n=1 Tax=Aspergillus fijiensis CBS 313.89 TaxID=1448319 RepID=A0A8G1VT90_9EURO|nr:uncharacterized protein BO72DRAFT_453299 [Aspergillus fijiensis CBS 313.89]RAK71837.1 hypothetical protein BO72DRAFT_453299 [Aspergillus fijiensis CBS 313.89]
MRALWQRDTKQEKKEADADGMNPVDRNAESDEESDQDEIALNLKESAPSPVSIA